MEIGACTLELSCLRHEFCISVMNERAWEGRVKDGKDGGGKVGWEVE